MDAKTLTEALRGHAFLEGLKSSHLQKVADMALEVSFGRDQIIFREGDECGLFYIVLSGKVALEISAPGHIVRIQTVGEGDELGWSSLLGEDRKHFRARTLEPVRALAFDGMRMRQTCEQDPQFGYNLMLRMLKVVAHRLQATRLQLLDMYAPRGAKLV